MADYGRAVLGTYSASCQEIKDACRLTKVPNVGDIVFFCEANKDTTNHAGLIYKVDLTSIYTIEGDTTGSDSVVTNGNCVATKSYSKTNARILGYGYLNYTDKAPMSTVITVALGEVGYLEKKSDSQLNSKTANAGNSGFTKYGKWMGSNGNQWSGSFISWCFHVSYDSSSTEYVELYGTGGEEYSTPTYVNQTQSNSSLVNYVNRLAAAQFKPRSERISRITIHISREIGDVYDLSRMLNSTEKSYNYGIDNSGTIGLFVDEAMWTSSSNNKNNDMKSVNIICMNETLSPDYKISDLCYEALVKLCEDICRRNFIFGLKYTGNSDVDSVTLHSEFNPKCDCPGPYVTSKIPGLVSEINNKLNVEVGVNFTKVSARLASNQSEALKVQSTVAVKSIKPYVIQPHRSVLGINYAALRELGVVGTMIDAGERFNSKHELVAYRTENVYKQTLEASYAGIPHAYFYTSYAKNIEDVKEEAYWFHMVVTKYPPKLGVWLHCQFSVKKATAQQLVDEWYKYFVKWGLKSKCGIYATKKQAEKIGWPKQCAYMPLWLEGEMVDSVCPDEEILTPSFFKLNNLSNQSMQSTGSNITSLTTITRSNESEEVQEQFDLPTEDPKEGQTEKDVSKAEKKQDDNTVEIEIPKDPNYTGMKKWESYTSIKSTYGRSYEITHSEEAYTDKDGFRMIANRYLLSVGSGVCKTIGTYLDVVLENGTVIECIMGDGQPDQYSDPVNHIFTIIDKNYCCSEFIVHNKEGVLNPTVRKSGDCSNKQDDWKSPVKKIKIYTENWFSED